MESRESEFGDSRLQLLAAIGLVAGAVFGIAGTFAPSASWRGLAWGVDGTALVVASALLAVHHFHRGNVLAAAGFLVCVVGEALVLSGAAMTLEASAPLFAAGVSLWAAMGAALTPLSEPLPFFAYPFLAATLFAWAWVHYRDAA
jgi:hypothetical protein